MENINPFVIKLFEKHCKSVFEIPLPLFVVCGVKMFLKVLINSGIQSINTHIL